MGHRWILEFTALSAPSPADSMLVADEILSILKRDFQDLGQTLTCVGSGSPISFEVGTQKLCLTTLDTGDFNQQFFINL